VGGENFNALCMKWSGIRDGREKWGRVGWGDCVVYTLPETCAEIRAKAKPMCY